MKEEIQFTRKRLGETKIMVRFDNDDYRTVMKIAKVSKESMGQVVRAIVKNYLKAENTKTNVNKNA